MLTDNDTLRDSSFLIILSMSFIIVTIMSISLCWAVTHYLLPEKETEILLVGLAVGEVGVKVLEGAAPEDEFTSGFYSRGRLAFYLKGKIKGEYLLTMACDTDKPLPDTFVSLIEPERYYPVYGDASELDRTASTHGKLYVKLERKESYLHYGNYDPEFTAAEFAAYSRELHGAKAYYRSKQHSLTIVEAQTRQVAARDWFPELKDGLVAPCEWTATADLGTSGPYYLTHIPVVPDTERVRLEIYDKDDVTEIIEAGGHVRDAKVIETRDQERDVDYTIDYSTGRLVFTNFVPSQTPEGNPIFIVVDYEAVPPGGPLHSILGAAAETQLGESLRLGATHIQDIEPLKEQRLTGLDFSLQLAENATLSGEYAQSTKEQRDTAHKVEVAYSPTADLELGAYYRRLGTNFLPFTEVTVDSEEHGASLQAGLGRYLSAAAEYKSEHDNVAGDPTKATTTPTTGSIKLDFAYLNWPTFTSSFTTDDERTVLDKEVTVDTTTQTIDLTASKPFDEVSAYEATVQLEDSIDRTKASPDTSTISGIVKVPIRIIKGLSTYVQEKLSTQKNRTTGELLSTSSTPTLGWEAIDGDPISVDGSYSLETAKDLVAETRTQTNTFNLGWKTAERYLVSTYGNYSVENSRELETETKAKTESVFLGAKAPITEKLSTTAGYEQEKTIETTEGVTFTYTSITTSVGLGYLISGFLDSKLKYDVKDKVYDETTETTTLISLDATYTPTPGLSITGQAEKEEGVEEIIDTTSMTVEGKVTIDLVASGSYSQARTWNKLTDRLGTRDIETGFGLAYRPVMHDKLNAFAKYESRHSQDLTTASATESTTNLLAIEGIYALTERLSLFGKYAMKKLDSTTFTSTADLKVIRADYYLTDKLDLATEYRILEHYDEHNYETTTIVEMGYLLARHFRVAVGYNFEGYEDLKLDDNSYSAKGPYLKLMYQL